MRMQHRRTLLLDFVFPGDCWMAAKIISENEMPLDLRGVGLEAVQIHEPRAVRIRLGAETSSFDSKLPVPGKPERFHQCPITIEMVETHDERHQVNDGFRCKTWN